MLDILPDLIKRYGLWAVAVIIILAALAWFVAHMNAQPGERLTVVWGMIEYTKDKSHPDPDDIEPSSPGGKPRTPLPSETVGAVRANRAPTIDGILNEDVWQATQPLNYAVHPLASGATNATVKLAWDDSFLYAGFDINDSQVESSSPLTPWDGDSASAIIRNGDKNREYRHSLPEYHAGPGIDSSYKPKGNTTLNNGDDRDEGFTLEMRIPWLTKPVGGSTVFADFLSVDHDGNPSGLFDDDKTIFSKISWDGDENVETAEKGIVLLR